MTADVNVDGQFAETNMHLVFYNEGNWSDEAEFVYTLPQGATATYFAYWAGKEKVVAKVVEKEKAAAIYGALTASQHDPALVEMIGKNTFRARVYPVWPGEDLKIEVRFVQILPSAGSNFLYTLPFAKLKTDAEQSKLDSVDVKVNARQTPGIQITNNYGLPIKKTSNVYNLTFKGRNFKPQKDFIVTLKRAPKPLQVSLATSPSGGSYRYFALALTPACDISKVRVSIGGIRTYEVVQTKRSTKAGQVILIVGKYSGSGMGAVTLSGISSGKPIRYSQSIIFNSGNASGSIASRLWAARRIEQLSRNGNKRTVMRLSMKFGLPSKYTSWLAVPEAEKKRYEEMRDQIDAELAARSLALMIADGKRSSAQAQNLRNRLNLLCKKLDWDPKQQIERNFSNICYDSATDLVQLISEGKGNSRESGIYRNRVTRISKLENDNPNRVIKEAAINLAHNLGEKLIEEQYGDTPSKSNIVTAQSQIRRLRSIYNKKIDDAVNQGKRWQANSMIHNFADQLVAQRVKEHPNFSKMARIEQQMSILEKLGDVKSKDAIRWRMNNLLLHDWPWLLQEIDRVETNLWDELGSRHSNKSRLRKLEKRFVELNTRYRDKDYAEARVERLEADINLSKLENNIIDDEYKANPEAAKKKLETRIEELRARMGDPMITVDAPGDAKRVVAVLPGGETKVLEYNPSKKQWEARFDIPLYAREGSYTIDIVIVLKDGTRKTLTMNYKVDTTPPSGQGKVSVKTELGQKFQLTLDADDDTARVIALMPWGERVEMVRSANDHRRFFAVVSVQNGHNNPAQVTFILTDRAHNRLSVLMDCETDK